MESPQKKSLRLLFDEQRPISVPRYQRAYAWESAEIEDLVLDIDRTIARREVEEAADLHFLGGVVMVRVDDPTFGTTVRWEIVDGQQRLATISILIRLITAAYEAIHDASEAEAEKSSDPDLRADLEGVAGRAGVMANELREQVLLHKFRDRDHGTEWWEPRLTLSEVDRDYFRSLVDPQESALSPTAESHQRMRAARSRLERKLVRPILLRNDLSGQQKLERLQRLERAALDYSYVVHIYSTNRHEAYQLFSILNDRGRSLSDGDLLRTRSLELLREHETMQAGVADSWESVLRNAVNSVDAYLRAYYASHSGARAPTRSLFDKFSEAFFPVEVEDEGQARLHAERIGNIASNYEHYASIADSKWPYAEPTASSWAQKRLERLIGVLGRSGDIPILLAARETKEEAFFADLVDELERLAFRYAAVRGHSGTFSEALYHESAKLRRAPDEYDIAQLERGIGVLVATRAPEEAFKAGLRPFLTYSPTSAAVNRRIKHALTTIDDYWRAFDRDDRRVPNREAPYDLDQVQVEHVYPQHPQRGHELAELTDLVHDLGNLAFWQGDENRLASNKPYVDEDSDNSKKPDLASAKAALTIEAGSHDAWTAETVRTRRDGLLDRLTWIYQLPEETLAAARLANRKFWVVYHELEPMSQVYSDVKGESYHFPRSIPNGTRIQEGDILLPFCSIQGENRFFGAGLAGEIEEDSEGYKVAYYSRYLDVEPHKPFSELPADPRTNTRNAINAGSVDLFRAVVGEIPNLDSLPAVANFANSSAV